MTRASEQLHCTDSLGASEFAGAPLPYLEPSAPSHIGLKAIGNGIGNNTGLGVKVQLFPELIYRRIVKVHEGVCR